MRRCRTGRARDLTVTALSATGFHLGAGLYFGFDGHWHGEWRGARHADGEYIADCTTPDAARRLHQLRDCIVARRRPGRRRRRDRKPAEPLRRAASRDGTRRAVVVHVSGATRGRGRARTRHIRRARAGPGRRRHGGAALRGPAAVVARGRGRGTRAGRAPRGAPAAGSVPRRRPARERARVRVPADGGRHSPGATVVGINPTRRGAELARDISHTDCQLIVTDGTLRSLLDDIALGSAGRAHSRRRPRRVRRRAAPPRRRSPTAASTVRAGSRRPVRCCCSRRARPARPRRCG